MGRRGHQGEVPAATVARLPRYLRALTDLDDAGVATVSSRDLGRAAGVNPAQVRKDLSFFGSYGTRGVGYRVDDLSSHVSRVLGLTQDWNVVLVGVGNLGRALASYRGFGERGFAIVALLDADAATVGRTVAGHVVEPIDDLDAIVADRGVSIAVLTVPVEAAQGVAERLVEAGITSILNFAPTHLDVPQHIVVRRVDLSTELGILAYHERRRGRLDSSGEARHASTAAPRRPVE
ncbi:MAG: redox-sensing transcriptional repressor Rex [Nitriliruptorales bacterium]